MPAQTNDSRWIYIVLATFLVLIAVVRIAYSYSHTAQAFDEPCHVGAAIELLDKGTYTLDPVHPPLARLTIGLPLYLAGERFPTLSLPESGNYNFVGDAILNDSGHYMRNLILARMGVLPFFLFGCTIVFLWARREFGNLAALMSVALFTTLPNVLAFSSVAYTDIVAATTQAAALGAFALWLEQHTRRTTLWLGLALGLAISAKATSVIFLPAAALGIIAVKYGFDPANHAPQLQPPNYKRMSGQLALASFIALTILWSTYGFAVGRVNESMNFSADSMPSFRNFPGPVAKIGHELVRADPRIPAPALIKGIASVWVLNHMSPPAYLLGHIKPGGWWYFFLVGVTVKSPIPFLILAIIGVFSSAQLARQGRWTALAPAICVLAVLLVTMPVKYNAGVRHVLVVFPLMAIIAGCGCAYLWNLPWNPPHFHRILARSILLALLIWQCVSTVRASGNFLAYFNQLAGRDPSRVMVAGCDLDCGQDLFALSHELQVRHVSHASLAVWTSADMNKISMPMFDVPQPYQPVAGWFAVSLRALRFGDLFHSTYPPDAFDWLKRYQPVAHVGKTILLYDIPGEAGRSQSQNASSRQNETR
jgi:hypothetical protein